MSAPPITITITPGEGGEFRARVAGDGFASDSIVFGVCPDKGQFRLNFQAYVVLAGGGPYEIGEAQATPGRAVDIGRAWASGFLAASALSARVSRADHGTVPERLPEIREDVGAALRRGL